MPLRNAPDWPSRQYRCILRPVKQIQIDRYGEPHEVARCVEVPDVGDPAAAEVVFDVLAFPVDPTDLWFCRGSHSHRPPLPATPGAECVGRVIAVGREVAGVREGDLVINLQRENWAQRRRVPADDVIVLPPGVDLRQASMLRINPPTALLLLTDVVPPAAGDWLVQNAANSAVGRLLVRLARRHGWRTVNVVRRPEPIETLRLLGGDACVVDGPDLAARVAAVTGDAAIRLGIDAVAGSATDRIGECLADGGTVCTYGSMSGENPTISRRALIYRGITLTGFGLGRALARRTLHQVRSLYAELGREQRAGNLDVPLERIYPIDAITEALRHAAQGGRGGKILVAPNGVGALD
jgi:mitochondrial enoyl-[acyl-carrier protein] reductase / trans-2-enoyl-CoA reductase